MKIGSRQFDTKNHIYLMGILNVTPDSFSDGGQFFELDAALRQAEKLISDGVDILDVGGESTRPGYLQVSDEEEAARIVPVIRELKKRYEVPISADTCKTAVAKAALDAGADMINDIWGLKKEKDMGEWIQRYGAACCLMHNRSQAQYTDFVPEVISDLKESVCLAKRAGIPEDKIILDPGVGFGKTYEMNLEILKRLDEFCALGYPLLLGASRKSVIGLTLDLPVGEREEGTIVTTVMALLAGCSFVRVHDVEANRRAIKMAEAILREHDIWTI